MSGFDIKSQNVSIFNLNPQMIRDTYGNQNMPWSGEARWGIYCLTDMMRCNMDLPFAPFAPDTIGGVLGESITPTSSNICLLPQTQTQCDNMWWSCLSNHAS